VSDYTSLFPYFRPLPCNQTAPKRITSTRYRDYEVIIGKIRTLTDLIKLEEMKFDVILKMD